MEPMRPGLELLDDQPEFMFGGLFYGVQGMRVGGVRRLRVAPRLAYRDVGVPGVIPPNAMLTVEVAVLSERAV
jgi:FKBP-type peptidyl-prolyl cis-trans isomerase